MDYSWPIDRNTNNLNEHRLLQIVICHYGNRFHFIQISSFFLSLIHGLNAIA